MAEKRIFLIFVDSFLNFGKVNKNCDYSANFHNFLGGLHYVDFTFAFDTTLIQLEMTDIWPKYVAQAFLPPLESSAQDPPWIGLRFRCFKIAQNPSNDVQLIKIGHNG